MPLSKWSTYLLAPVSDCPSASTLWQVGADRHPPRDLHRAHYSATTALAPVVRPECADSYRQIFFRLHYALYRAQKSDQHRLCYEPHGQMRKKCPDRRIELLRVEQTSSALHSTEANLAYGFRIGRSRWIVYHQSIQIIEKGGCRHVPQDRIWVSRG